MSIGVAVQAYSPAVNPDRVFLKLAFSGNYVSGGDTLNLTPSTWTDPNNIGVLGGPLKPPVIVPSVYSQSFTASQLGYYCQVIQGTTLANYKLQILQGGGAELGAGAYPAGILAGEVFVELPL